MSPASEPRLAAPSYRYRWALELLLQQLPTGIVVKVPNKPGADLEPFDRQMLAGDFIREVLGR